MFEQLKYFIIDYNRYTNGKIYKKIFIWMSPTILGIFYYRFLRGFYVLTKKNHIGGLVKLFYPITIIVLAITKIDINYKCDIGPGIMICHSNMGVVISQYATIGKKLTLVGGNIIGLKYPGKIFIGDNVNIGGNATVIGPLKIGNNVIIGASACVVSDILLDSVVAGVPAKILKNKT